MTPTGVVNAHEIILYGTDIPATTDVNSMIALASLSALVSIDLSTWTYYKNKSDESEKVKGEGQVLLQRSLYRNKYTFNLEELSINTGMDTVDYLFDTVLGKNYNYISGVQSPYTQNIATAGNVLAVICEAVKDDQPGNIPIVLTCLTRKPVSR